MKSNFKLNKSIRVVLITIVLTLYSISMISCSGGSIKQKDGKSKNSINMIAPRAEEITFNDTGRYTIYLQTEGELNGKYYSIPEYMEGLSVKIYNKEKEIKVHEPKGRTTISIGSNTYIGIFEFEIDEIGAYTLESNLNNNQIQEVGIKLGKSNAVFFTILKILLIFLFVIIVIVLFIIRFIFKPNLKIKEIFRPISDNSKNSENNMNYLGKPKKVPKVISLIPHIVGIASWIVTITILISSTLVLYNSLDNINHVLVPGKQEITLEESGKYSIYLDMDGVIEGKRYIIPKNIDGSINSRIYSKDKSKEIKLNSVDFSFDNESNKLEIFNFKVEKSGTYVIETQLVNSNIKNAVLSIENSSVIFGFVLKVIISIIIWIIGNCIWGIGFVIVNNKNKKYEQEFKKENMFYEE